MRCAAWRCRRMLNQMHRPALLPCKRGITSQLPALQEPRSKTTSSLHAVHTYSCGSVPMCAQHCHQPSMLLQHPPPPRCLHNLVAGVIQLSTSSQDPAEPAHSGLQHNPRLPMSPCVPAPKLSQRASMSSCTHGNTVSEQVRQAALRVRRCPNSHTWSQAQQTWSSHAS